MKIKLLLPGMLLSLVIGSNAQTIPNAGFEHWTHLSYSNPNAWTESANTQSIGLSSLVSVTKVTGVNSVGSGIQLQSYSDSLTSPKQAEFGYILMGIAGNGNGISSLTGGVPFTQQPAQLQGFYQCSVMSGDTAIVFVMFKKAGQVISQSVKRFAGSQKTYTSFTLAITPFNNGTSPDSLIIGAVSSNILANNSVAVAGSSLTLDNLTFPGITDTIPNGSFESWTTLQTDKPDGWYDEGLAAIKSTNSQTQSYALLLTSTVSVYSNGNISGQVGTAYYPNNCQSNCNPIGGSPLIKQQDTLEGYYQYIPMHTDTANIYLQFIKNGVSVNGTSINLYSTVSSGKYTKFKIPFDNTPSADTVQISISSSYSSHSSPTCCAGSQLYIDNLYFASVGTTLGIPEYQLPGEFSVYPNPANESFKVKLDIPNSTPLTIQLISITGEVITSETYSDYKGSFEKEYSMDGIAKSIYMVRAITNDQVYLQKVVVQ